jgi:hypothetical protein
MESFVATALSALMLKTLLNEKGISGSAYLGTAFRCAWG